MKGYQSHGRIGKKVMISQLSVGDLYWDTTEQCAFLIVENTGESTFVRPLMPNSEDGVYEWDVEVRAFALIKEHVTLMTPSK